MAEEDGYPSVKLFNRGYSYTYDDVIFLPHYIDFPTDAVSLSTRLSRNIALSIPCVASPMDTVTEAHMAAAMASIGGIGIIHSNVTPSSQAAMVRHAKSRRVPILSNPVFASPDSRPHFDEFDDKCTCILVTETGASSSKLLGCVWKREWLQLKDRDAKVTEYMQSIDGSSVAVPWNFDLAQIDGILEEKKRDSVVLEKEDGEVVDVVTKEEVERVKGYPRLPGKGSVGSDGKWIVGAAMGTRESDKERLEHLVKAGTNVVVLDSSQGNSIYQIEMIKYVKRTYPRLDVIGGNVVTVAQAKNLIEAGVDGLRVGMGSGSICTTQEVCAVGRGQVKGFFCLILVSDCTKEQS